MATERLIRTTAISGISVLCLGVGLAVSACGAGAPAGGAAAHGSASSPAAPSGSATATPSGSAHGKTAIAAPAKASTHGSGTSASDASALVPMQTSTGGEFLSPSGNISCEVSMTYAYCQTGSPARSVKMDTSGSYHTCTGEQCLGNSGEGTPTLGYGTSTGVGAFRCTSEPTGITCLVGGKGFLISSSGVSSVPSGTGTAGAFSAARTAWKTAATVPEASMNAYLEQAASDLRATGNRGYDSAISELNDLASLPLTSLTPAQQARRHSDTQKLDAFFGTPGLIS